MVSPSLGSLSAIMVFASFFSLIFPYPIIIKCACGGNCQAITRNFSPDCWSPVGVLLAISLLSGFPQLKKTASSQIMPLSKANQLPVTDQHRAIKTWPICLDWGQFWRVNSVVAFPMRLTEVFVGTASQLNMYLSPLLFHTLFAPPLHIHLMIPTAVPHKHLAW